MTATRVLVVDDEPDVEALVRQKFRRQIRNGDIEFVFAGDGIDALEVLDREPDVEVVLSDINMPRMDGLKLLEALGKGHEHLKTVVVSAYGDMHNIRSAMNLGAFDFVTKPIEFEDLETTLEKTLKHIRAIKALQGQRDSAIRAQATLSRYFSPAIAARLAESPDAMAPGGERRVATFLFTDLAEFTPLVEAGDSEMIVDLLQEYFSNLTRIVFDHGGTVMKIVGDSLHAAFGAPADRPDHARAAVACALAIDRFSEDFRAAKNAGGIAIGLTRIGINTGPAVIGNFGGENFFDYTAYGDTVNVAARLENANKSLQTRICVSQSVVDEIADFCGRPVGDLLLKGKSQPLRTWEPLTPEAGAGEAAALYRQAFALLEAGDPGARQAFARIVSTQDDALAAFHLTRILSGVTGTEIVPHEA